MKNLIILTALFSIAFLAACGQKNPPENVKQEFSKKFTEAKSVKWESEESTEWEAGFKLGGKEMTASFDLSGKWLETETEVNVKELPAPVANSLKNEFPGMKVKECSIIENPEIKGFEIALKSKENELTVIIGSDGTVLKKESNEENVEESVGEKKENEENESDEAGEAKEIKTPEKIISAFTVKFPGATAVEWGSESPNEWEAEFKLEGKEMSACFDSSAVWTCSETVIKEKDLPQAVITTLKTEFAGYKKSLIEIYEDSSLKGYELILKKGETSSEVIFDNNGKVVKKQDIIDNEEEEK